MSAPPFTLAGARRGFLVAQPLAVGILIYGAVFGVLAASARLSWLEAALMSGFMFSASAQVAALQSLTDHPALLPLVVTILVINARYLLYGAALRPWLTGLGAGRIYGTLFCLGDNSFALSMRQHAAGHEDAGFLLGSGMALFVPWVTGTLIGHLGGSLVPSPAAYALDFSLVAFSAAMAASMWRGGADVLSGLAAAAVAIALSFVLAAGWVVIGAGLTSAVIAYARFDRRPPGSRTPDAGA